jgi:hypothetical protein
VLVRGDKKWGDAEHINSDNTLQHVYAWIITLDAKTTCSGSKYETRTYVGAATTRCEDWNTIGVDTNKLKRLKVACFPAEMPDTARKAKKFGVKLTVSSSQMHDDDDNDEPSSEINDRVHNEKPPTFSVNVMPKCEEFVPWDSCKHLPRGQSGRAKNPCIIFKFKCNWCILPAAYYPNTHAYIGGRSTGAVLLVRNTERGFEIKPPDIEGAYVPEMKKTSVQKADMIPTDINPMRILGGYSKCLNKGNSGTVIYLEKPDRTVGYYYLPYHLRAQINVKRMQRPGEDPLDGNVLTGFNVRHPEKRKMRVNGAKSRVEEVMLTILNPDGRVVAESVALVSGRKRKRDAARWNKILWTLVGPHQYIYSCSSKLLV